MKFKTVFLIALLAIPLMGFAKGSSSFSRGFSGSSSSSASRSSSSSFSRPSSPSKSAAPAPSPTKSSFGSFGSAKPATPPAPAPAKKSTSAMTQSLDKKASQAAALKTLDAKPVLAGAAVGSTIGSNIQPPMGTAHPGQVGAIPVNAPTGYVSQGAPAPTVIYQNSGSSGFMNGVMGYMLGRSMSHNNSNDRANYNTIAPGSPNRAMPDSVGDPVQPVQSSSGYGVLLFILGVLALAGVWYFWRRRRTNAAVTSKQNYSL